MSPAGNDSREPSGNAIVAARRPAWVLTPLAEGEYQAHGFPAEAVAIVSPDQVASSSFAESQQAGLAAVMSLAETATAASQLPAEKSATRRPEAPASRHGAPTSTAPASPPPVARPAPATDPVAPATDRAEVPVRPAPATPGRRPATGRRSGRKRRMARNGYSFLASVPGMPLKVILTVQAALSLRLVWSNTAFSDEALYLWSGRLEWAHWLRGMPIPAFPTYFSGAPVVYPPLASLATALGGLAGARILSLLFMLSATVLLHGVTRRIFDERSANFAAALFAGLGTTQFLGAFATYDAMALLLLALATWLGIRAAGRSPRVQLLLLTGAGGALALADAAKYAAALFDPIVIIVVGLTAWRAGSRKNGLVAGLTVPGVLGLLLLIGIKAAGHAYWRGINFTTLTRAHGGSSPAGIIADSSGWVAFVAVLAVIGCVVALAKQAQLPAKLCACTLACAVACAPANQARIHVFTSLFKHVGFGAWFAAAVAGYALACLADAVPAVKERGALRTGVGVAVASLLVGAALAQNHFESWPDATTYIAKLRGILPAHKGHILAADNGNVIEYYLGNELNGLSFSGPWFLRYQDPETGKYYINGPAYVEAIKHRYFSVIALSFADSRVADLAIAKDIRTYGGYKLVATLPYKASGLESAFRIWVREGPG